MKGGSSTCRIATFLLLGVVLVYLPALQGGFIWDDQDYVVHNNKLLSAEGLWRIWTEPRSMVMVQWYPLVHTVLWLQYRLWGLHPQGYHLVNILLHALNAVVLLLVLKRLRVPGSALIAAVFGLHPMQVESVAWITEIKNTLSGCFGLSAILAYVVYLDSRTTGRFDHVHESSRGAAVAYMLSLGFLQLALLSKPTAITIAPTLLVLTWWKSPKPWPRAALLLVPHHLLAVAQGVFAWWLEAGQLGAPGTEHSLSLLQRVLLAGRVIWFYPSRLVWPAELMFIYPRWSMDPRWWWQYLFAVGAGAAIVALWFLRERLGKGPLVAVLVYLLNIMPVAGIIEFYFMKFSFVGDHFQYLAGIGALALVIASVTRTARSFRPPGGAFASRALPAALLMAFGALTWKRTAAFRDEEALWRDTISKNPSAWVAHINLGNVLMDKGNLAGAIERYRVALVLKPNDADSHYTMGVALERQGQDHDAIKHYLRAAEIAPNQGFPYYNIGALLERWGNLTEAERYYATAVRLVPQSYWQSYKPLESLGSLLARRGEFDQAARLLSRALEINPGNEELRNKLNDIESRRKR